MKPYLGISLVLLAAALALVLVMRQCEQSTRRQLAAIKNSIAEVLKVQPEVRINQKIIYAQTSPIAELAIVTKEQLVEYTWIENSQLLGHAIPLTEKKISAGAVYRLKAGFDLTQPFVVTLDSKTGKITASLPAAKILSVEMEGAPELKEQASPLASIPPEQRQEVLKGLDTVAHQAANNSGLAQDAERQAQARLQEIFQRNSQTVQIELKPRL